MIARCSPLEQYQAWKALITAGDPVSAWQKAYVYIYQAFIEKDRWKQYLNGVGTTLYVTAMALVLGVILGMIVAIVRAAHDQQRPGRHNPILGLLNGVFKVYVTVIRGTPMMVQLLIMGFVIFSSSKNFALVGALTLGINSGAYQAEIIRGGLMSVDAGQMEAGRSLGLPFWTTMTKVIMPQAIRNILPALCNEGITLLKETSIAGYIGIVDLTKAAMLIRSQTYDAFIPLIFVALIYLVIVLVLQYLVGRLERRLNSAY